MKGLWIDNGVPLKIHLVVILADVRALSKPADAVIVLEASSRRPLSTPTLVFLTPFSLFNASGRHLFQCLNINDAKSSVVSSGRCTPPLSHRLSPLPQALLPHY